MIDKWDTKKRELLLMYEDCARNGHAKYKAIYRDDFPLYGSYSQNGVDYFLYLGYLVAKIDNKIIATCNYFVLEDLGVDGIVRINSVYVEPEYRNRKIASTMLLVIVKATEKFLPNSGILSSQGGESEAFYNLLLSLGAYPTNVINCFNKPILFCGYLDLLDKMTIAKAKGLNHYLRLEREGTKHEANFTIERKVRST